MIQKIALYGGSFDPIHHGHLIIARSVAEALSVDRVVFLPARTPPHKPDAALTDADHRANMVRLAIEPDDTFLFSDFDLTCDGPSYTVNTVTHFRETAPPQTELFWIIGADSLCDLHTWYMPDRIAKLCRIVTAARPGFAPTDLSRLAALLDQPTLDRLVEDIIETPRIEICSTDIRRRVAQGKSIRYLVPDAVADYIDENELYRKA